MTTPQDPQNPYGEPQEPSSPSGEPPAGQPTPPEQPTQPPQYGQPQPTQPVYGQPTQQPGQPGQYGAPAYGQPGFPAGQATDEPSKAMAITSLVLSFISCTVLAGIVSIVLAIIVLMRGKDGRNHGKGFAIAGLIISIIGIVGAIAAIVLGVLIGNSIVAVNDLKAGQCITADGLTSDDDTVTDIATVECSEPHDGEVLATKTLSAEEAEGYGDETSNQLCVEAVTEAGKFDVLSEQVNFIGLTQTLTPDGGDKLACVAFNTDGSKLEGRLEPVAG